MILKSQKKLLFGLIGLLLLGGGFYVLQGDFEGLFSDFKTHSLQQTNKPQVYGLSGPTMGTRYNIKLALSPSRSKEIDALSQGIAKALLGVEQRMSTYRDNSELSQFNVSSPGDWVLVSDPLFRVISAAQDLSKRSAGAFDVTVGPLVNLWGFGPEHKLDEVPTDDELSKAFQRVGYEKLLLDTARKRIKKKGDLYLDLSAIAKGYGVDKIVQLLRSNDIESALVEVGGEIRAFGLKPDGKDWRIAIESPISNLRAVQKIIALKDSALATSGDYRNYFEKDSVRYSHTIDSRTGRPITHKLASVTVLHESCMLADGLATMFMAMGPDAAMNYANNHNIAIFMLVKRGDTFAELSSKEFETLFGDS